MPRPRVLARPNGDWVQYLARGNLIWLCKEDSFGCCLTWEQPRRGHVAGTLTLCRVNAIGTDLEQADDVIFLMNHISERWFVKSRGEGFDGSQLILPVEGHIGLNFQAEGVEPDALNELRARVQDLENKVRFLGQVAEFPFYRQNVHGQR